MNPSKQIPAENDPDYGIWLDNEEGRRDAYLLELQEKEREAEAYGYVSIFI